MEAIAVPQDFQKNQQKDLEVVQRLFAEWRVNKQKGERIPLRLWTAAASLAGRHSVHQIARALRLNFVELRDHIRGKPSRRFSSQTKSGKRTTAVSPFVELPVTTAGQPGRVDCRLKLHDGRRARLTVRLQGVGIGPLVQLLREVWGREA
jgi:hypothetical protein